MNKPRILIITYNWPPRNAIGTHRPYSWAKYWSGYGAEITILTAKKYAFDAPLDLDLKNLPDVVVHEIPYLNLSQKSTLIFRLGFFRAFAKKLKKVFMSIFGFSIDPRSGWVKSSRSMIHKLAFKVDIVVSTFGPAASHLIAKEMKLINPQIRWIADYRDLWSLNYTDKMPNWSKKSLKKLEIDTIVGYCDAISTVSNGLSKKLQKLFKLPVIVSFNGYDISNQSVFHNLSKSKEISNHTPIKIIYTGAIYKGFRDPSPLFEALFILDKKGAIVPGDITIEFYGGSLAAIEECKYYRSCARYIHIRGHVSRNDALVAQSNADLLLLLESPHPDASLGLTGKIFEYIVTGVPVMSLGSLKNSAIDGLLSETGTGYCFEDSVAEIVKALLILLDGKAFSWFNPNYDKITFYSRENQAKILYDYCTGAAKCK
jgi:glycosyltransferase involved in cell wall biosynthesis